MEELAAVLGVLSGLNFLRQFLPLLAQSLQLLRDFIQFAILIFNSTDEFHLTWERGEHDSEVNGDWSWSRRGRRRFSLLLL